MVLVFFGMVCNAMSKKKKPVCVVRSFAQGIIHGLSVCLSVYPALKKFLTSHSQSSGIPSTAAPYPTFNAQNCVTTESSVAQSNTFDPPTHNKQALSIRNNRNIASKF